MYFALYVEYVPTGIGFSTCPTSLKKYPVRLFAPTVLVCQNFEQYQKLCGVIQGLALAESYVMDLAKKVEESND
jgi:hypothetical protein